MPNRLFIITGDYSGDVHAANVVRALRAQQPDIELAAVGGKQQDALGVHLVSDQSRMGRLGFGSVLGAPYHYTLGEKIMRYVKDFKPQAVLLIDYGVFNLYMAAKLQRLGIKVFYFIPPQVWATRKGRIHKIKKHVDHVFCIFPFEETLYQSYGIPVTYVGHPLVGKLPPPANKAAFRQELGFAADEPIVGILPGSRKLEIDYLLGPFLQSLPAIQKRHPKARFVLAKAGSVDSAYLQKQFEKAASQLQPGETLPPVTILENRNYDVLSASDCLIAASGTVTLEAALYNTPMVISYKLHPVIYQIAIRITEMPCVGLPNILTDPFAEPDKLLVPEFLQDRCKPALIANKVSDLLNLDDPGRQRQLEGFAQIRNALSQGSGPENVAQGILSLLG